MHRILGLLALLAGAIGAAALTSIAAGSADRRAQAIPGLRGTIWVTNRVLNNVTVFDPATGGVVATIPTGRSSADVAVSQRAGKAYVTNETDNSISVVSTSSRSVIGTIAVGAVPHHIKVSQDGRRVYFGEFGTNKIGVIDTRTDAFTEFAASTNAAARSHSPFPSRDGKTVFVANEIGDEVVALDAATGQTRFTVAPGSRPSEILATPDGRSLYIAVRGENKLKLLDLTTRAIARELTVGTQPDTLQLTPDGRTLVIGLRGQPAQMVFVDTASFTVSATVTIGGVGTTAAHEWLSASGRYVYSVFEGPGAGIAVIDRTTASVVGTLPYPGGGRPHGVYYADPAAIEGPGLTVGAQSARAGRSPVVRVAVGCGAVTIVDCRARVSAFAIGVGGLPGGGASTIAAGSSRAVTIGLNARALRALERNRTLRVRVRVTAFDRLDSGKTVLRTVVLRAGRR